MASALFLANSEDVQMEQLKQFLANRRNDLRNEARAGIGSVLRGFAVVWAVAFVWTRRERGRGGQTQLSTSQAGSGASSPNPETPSPAHRDAAVGSGGDSPNNPKTSGPVDYGALGWAVYAFFCFLATTFFNIAMNDWQFKKIYGACNEHYICCEPDQSCGTNTLLHILGVNNEKTGKQVLKKNDAYFVEPYDEAFEYVTLWQILIRSFLVAIFIATLFRSFLIHSTTPGWWPKKLPKWPDQHVPFWSAAIIVIFSMSALGVVRRLDDTIVVTTVVYGSVLAVVYATMQYVSQDDKRKDLNPRQQDEKLKIYTLFVQAGFAVFVAFCVSLMWELSKGTGERYKEATDVYARLEVITNVRIATHAALISLGVLGGIVAPFVCKIEEVIAVLKEEPKS